MGRRTKAAAEWLSFRIILCCVVAGTTQAQTEFETYIDTNYGFSVDYSAVWQIIESQDTDGGTHLVDARQNLPPVALKVYKGNSNQNR